MKISLVKDSGILQITAVLKEWIIISTDFSLIIIVRLDFSDNNIHFHSFT